MDKLFVNLQIGCDSSEASGGRWIGQQYNTIIIIIIKLACYIAN